jgi:hypothetical protein
MSRLYGKILRDLIEEENKGEEEQSGFRTGRSCTDNIFCMKRVIEKRNATNQETHIFCPCLYRASLYTFTFIPTNAHYTIHITVLASATWF